MGTPFPRLYEVQSDLSLSVSQIIKKKCFGNKWRVTLNFLETAGMSSCTFLFKDQ